MLVVRSSVHGWGCGFISALYMLGLEGMCELTASNLQLHVRSLRDSTVKRVQESNRLMVKSEISQIERTAGGRDRACGCGEQRSGRTQTRHGAFPFFSAFHDNVAG